MTNSPCPHWYFTCANGECINKDFVCDGLVACSDWSDESFTYASCIGGRYGGIIVIITGCFALVIIFVVGAFICWRECSYLHQDPILRDPEYTFVCCSSLQESNPSLPPSANTTPQSHSLQTASYSHQLTNQSQQLSDRFLSSLNQTQQSDDQTPRTQNQLLQPANRSQSVNDLHGDRCRNLANDTRGLQQAHEHNNEAYLSDIGWPENRMSRLLSEGQNGNAFITNSHRPNEQSVILPCYEELFVSN